ncbi:hypothetical protein GCM10010300_68920 [Streptomyces olivaceoviridis]|uniref:Lsr2 family protein n=1 Tax=Streptomyces olivaceoviridis TaxID=1921 RepID=UPI001996B25C|nr:Lsr2 family protein [Streptomyces olivaceoviridis]GGZ15127.1 hypothetical protein GCM10010300_68920 [Streptomyces olivaceoviridis]
MLISPVEVAVRHTPGWGPYWPDGLLAAGAATGLLLTPFSRHTRRGHRPALAVPPRPGSRAAAAAFPHRRPARLLPGGRARRCPTGPRRQCAERSAPEGRGAAVRGEGDPFGPGLDSGRTREELAAIRTWARANGHQITDAGTIRKSLSEACDAAHRNPSAKGAASGTWSWTPNDD